MATTQGLDPGFADSLSRMIAASGGRLYIVSGYRSNEEQANLYSAAIKKYGSPEAAQRMVAPPGRSNHNRGWAADLGGDIEWAHQHAAQYGLTFPMDWERWHIEPVWARSKSSPDSYTTPPAGEVNPTSDAAHQTSQSLMASFSDNLRKVLMGDLPGSTVDPLTGAPVAAGSTGTGGPGGAGASGATGPGSLMSSPERVKWAQDFLGALGKPVTAANITAVVAWQQAESGGGGGRFNPLNTTQGGFQGETNLNSVGVKNYQSYEDGIAANVKVINNGRYGNILAALDAGNDPMAVARAVAATPWGTGAGVERVLGQNQTIIQPPGQPKPAAAAAPAPAPVVNPNQPRRVKMS